MMYKAELRSASHYTHTLLLFVHYYHYHYVCLVALVLLFVLCVVYYWETVFKDDHRRNLLAPGLVLDADHGTLLDPRNRFYII